MVSDIRLSSEEKSKRIKQALAKYPYLKEKRRLAKLRQKREIVLLIRVMQGNVIHSMVHIGLPMVT